MAYTSGNNTQIITGVQVGASKKFHYFYYVPFHNQLKCMSILSLSPRHRHCASSSSSSIDFEEGCWEQKSIIILIMFFVLLKEKKKKTGNHSRPFLVIGLALDISRSCLGFQFQHHHVCAVVNSADTVVVIVIIVYREHRSQITKKNPVIVIIIIFSGCCVVYIKSWYMCTKAEDIASKSQWA